MASSVNTLIGNMSLLDQDGEYTLSDTNLISIDISDNRIGINTLDPSYSIHVKDTNDTSGIISTSKMITQDLDTSNITANSLRSNQVVPSDNDINKLDLGQNISFNISDKYYYKDQTSRSRCDITYMNKDIKSIIEHPNYVNKEISTGKTFRLKNNQKTNYIDSNFSNYPRSRLSVPIYNIILYEYNLINNYSNYDISENITPIPDGDTNSNFLINVDGSNIPLSNSWGPKILNQGPLGDCFAFTSSVSISFSYIRYLKYNLQIDINDSLFAEIANYMLPSMIYIEKLFNRVTSTYMEQFNPFQQGGIISNAVYNYLIQDSNILEFQYSYPLFLTSFYSFSTMSDDTKNYLINEYVDKAINDTPNDILTAAKAQNYYKKVCDPFNKSIVDICFNLHFMLKKDTLYDASFTSTWFSGDGSGSYLTNTYNKILNNVIDTIDNSYALLISFTVANNPMFTPGSNNTEFRIPTSKSDIEGGHAVTIVGYNNADKKFIIQNSWGYLGINKTGYFYLDYNIIKFLLKFETDVFKDAWFYVKFS